MSDNSEPSPAATVSAPPWTELWQSFVESSRQMTDAWSSSMAPFMLSRLLEQPAGLAVGNSTDYTEIPLPGGHVGLFVSSKSRGKLSKSIADWLIARDAASASKT